MNEFIPVENYKDLVRDSKTQAILSTSTTEIEEYQKRKRLAQAKVDRINSIEDSIVKINEKFSEVFRRLSELERK